MNKFFLFPVLLALALFGSCQKQETEAERNAEIQRQVQERLDAEHQAQERQQLDQRQAELDAREKELAEKQKPASETPPVRSSRTSDTPRMSDDSENAPTASYSTFYTKLEQHGDWRETSDYGYVWQPREAGQSRNWRPYTNGHWAYTDAGWTWVSEEPFGWATYHYGRWTRLRNIGWVWVPGDEWAPAWVSWRKSNDYVGWAPLPPEARFDRRTGIHNWSDNYYEVGPDQYSFVPTNQFGAQRIEHSVVSADRNVTIINQTTNVTNITYSNTTVVNQGPSYEELRTRTQQPIQRLRLEREVNVNLNLGASGPVVRGEVIFVPAPLIARAQAVERPTRVKETIAHATVDRGWEAIPDREAAEKVRVKMRAEATPPPNAPPKTFVKPVQGPARPMSAAIQSATVTPTAAISAAPSANAIPAVSGTPAATAAPAITATPATTAIPRSSPPTSLKPRPTSSTVIPPRASVSPGASESPNEELNEQKRLRESRRKSQELQQRLKQPQPRSKGPMKSPEPASSPSSSSEISQAPSSTPSQPGVGGDQRNNDDRILRRQQKKIEKSNAPAAQTSPSGPAAAAMPMSSPLATATISPAASEFRKKEERKRKREAEESASPSPSTAPQ